MFFRDGKSFESSVFEEQSTIKEIERVRKDYRLNANSFSPFILFCLLLRRNPFMLADSFRRFFFVLSDSGSNNSLRGLFPENTSLVRVGGIESYVILPNYFLQRFPVLPIVSRGFLSPSSSLSLFFSLSFSLPYWKTLQGLIERSIVSTYALSKV